MSKKTIEMKDGKPVISLNDIEKVRKLVLRWVNLMINGCEWHELPYLCMFVASYLKKLGIAAEIRVGIDIRGVEYCNVLLLYVTDMEWPEENFKADEYMKRWKESHIVDEFIVLNEDEGNARHVALLSKIIENACQNLANYVSKQTNVKKTLKQPKTQQQ
jgi:hypothetical protein